MDFRERLAAFADIPDECWPWPGGRGNRGLYGWTSVSDGHGGAITKWTHRLAYELLVGPIPDGLTLDHLCENTLCMNPAHMEPVTRAENSRRMRAKRRPTHCVNGHPRTPDNLGVTRTRAGGTFHWCRVCKREQQRQREQLPEYRAKAAARARKRRAQAH